MQQMGEGNPKTQRDEKIIPTPNKKSTLILPSITQLYPERPEWSHSFEQLHQAQNLPEMVLLALQLGLLFARIVLEEELTQRAQVHQPWGHCPTCRRRLRSKGFVSRHMETLIGSIT